MNAKITQSVPAPENTDRRSLLLGAAAAGATAFAGGAAEAKSRREIEVGVDAALEEMFNVVRGSRSLYNRCSGVLVIPEVYKGGFLVAGAYGEGALRIGGRTNSYWRYAAASLGFQAGVQRTRQALFFMTRRALNGFRYSDDGFEVGADAEVTLIDKGAEVAIDTTKDRRPILALVFSREGLLGGASVQGGKYTQIYR
ncbi:MAG: lipid-binding SYLF domain-containing protein [Neomegalonema sp.]|nr:lipid-binding SYLF domain-containing protein [Neomegalonema sp.]